MMPQNPNLAALRVAIPHEDAQLEAASACLLQMVGQRDTGFPHMTLDDAREIARVIRGRFQSGSSLAPDHGDVPGWTRWLGLPW
jgi:hypothetical protein